MYITKTVEVEVQTEVEAKVEVELSDFMNDYSIAELIEEIGAEEILAEINDMAILEHVRERGGAILEDVPVSNLIEHLVVRTAHDPLQALRLMQILLDASVAKMRSKVI